MSVKQDNGAMNCCVCSCKDLDAVDLRENGGDGLCAGCWDSCQLWARRNNLPFDVGRGYYGTIPSVTLDAWLEAGKPYLGENK